MDENKAIVNYCAEEIKCKPCVQVNVSPCCSCSENNTGGSDDGHSPYVGENGNWFEWSADANDFIDTGVCAEGSQGIQGQSGIDGKSAYEIAMTHGFLGTETEWLASLKGGGYDDILITGKETLTNKLLNGKPVYQMLVDCGKAPLCTSNGVIAVNDITVNVDHPDTIWIQSAHLFNSDGMVFSLPWISNTAVNNPSNYIPRRTAIYITGKTANTCGLQSTNSAANVTNANITAILQYTKTTDTAVHFDQ